MRRRAGTLAVAAALLLGPSPAAPAAAPRPGSGPSVLVRLAPLHRGSLPHVVTVYGRAQTDPAARLAITAPAAAVVGAIGVRAGEAVAKGAPLVDLEPSPATAAAYAQAVSALKVAGDLTRRTRTLLGQHLATAQELAAAEKSEADARATLAALTAEGASGLRVLRSPFAGVVSAVSTSPGALVAQGTVLVDLARSGNVVLRAGAVPKEAAAIRPGDPAAVTALGAHRAAAGTVLLKGAMIDPQSGLVPVVIAVPDGRLLAGETAEARIVTGRIPGWVVPHGAILVTDAGTPYVVEAKDRIARKVPVRILGSERGSDVVAGPLDPAAALVLDGNYQLEDGMRVRLPGSAPGSASEAGK